MTTCFQIVCAQEGSAICDTISNFGNSWCAASSNRGRTTFSPFTTLVFYGTIITSPYKLINPWISLVSISSQCLTNSTRWLILIIRRCITSSLYCWYSFSVYCNFIDRCSVWCSYDIICVRKICFGITTLMMRIRYCSREACNVCSNSRLFIISCR